MSQRLQAFALLLVLAGAAGPPAVAAQAAADSEPAVLARLRHTRDTFIRRAGEEGYRVCPAPVIALGDPPAFGRFDAQQNTLTVAVWSALAPAQRERFVNLAAHSGGHDTPAAMFADGIYGWVLVHELAHWWQACRHSVRERSYGAEAGANRIALAFWREQDPGLAARMLATFAYLRTAIESPVPPELPKAQYLDDHFLAIAQGRGYLWYQADMGVELAAEQPAPSFHKALSQPLYPW
jgi:hypothetical protein